MLANACRLHSTQSSGERFLQLDLTIVYEPGEDAWVIASIPEVAGVFSQGRTREEARTNVIDALCLMLLPEPREADDRREREPLHLTIAA